MVSRRTAALVVCLALAGCTRSNMDSQPKYHEYESSSLFDDGKVLQAPPAGTVARDEPARAEDMLTKPPLTKALLARGRERYDVFCSPCHDRVGTGHGMIVERGMPRPPSYHEARLRAAADQHFFDVMTRGYGAMYSYADRVSPRDRWAIVAYIRALQLSQHAAASELRSEERAKLAGAPP